MKCSLNVQDAVFPNINLTQNITFGVTIIHHKVNTIYLLRKLPIVRLVRRNINSLAISRRHMPTKLLQNIGNSNLYLPDNFLIPPIFHAFSCPDVFFTSYTFCFNFFVAALMVSLNIFFIYFYDYCILSVGAMSLYLRVVICI